MAKKNKKDDEEEEGLSPEITEEEILAGEKLAEEELKKEGDEERYRTGEGAYKKSVTRRSAKEGEAPVDPGPINPTTGEPVIPPGTPQPENREEVPTGTQDSIPGPDNKLP